MLYLYRGGLFTESVSGCSLCVCLTLLPEGFIEEITEGWYDPIPIPEVPAIGGKTLFPLGAIFGRAYFGIVAPSNFGLLILFPLGFFSVKLPCSIVPDLFLHKRMGSS